MEKKQLRKIGLMALMTKRVKSIFTIRGLRTFLSRKTNATLPSPEEQILDFSLYDQLPRVNPDEDSSTAGPGIDGFDLERVIAAIQNGYSATDLQDYLSHYYEHDKALLRERLNAEVKGFPAIFFVVETNDADILRYWIKYGGDPNATHGPFRFPLLAFAILRCARPRLQAAKTVETLLRFGASAAVIPAAFYDPFDRDLPESGPDEQELQDTADDERLWCTPEIRPRLTAALSLTQRYRLWQASGVDQASGRERTLALRKGAEEILGLQQTVIGQRLATWSLRKTFLINLALPGRKPLVLLFAGPKGHGKSELTNQLAKILSLEPERVGRTSATHEEAFGTKVLDESTDAGSPLNDFLSRNTGHRSLVFIEEFEKASEQLYKELVIPFDRGEYTDRRNGQPIDCSQTIWILETSKFNDTVRGFFQLNNKHLKDSSIRSEHQTLRRQLSRDLRGECVASFGAPLSSRITEIIPFSTFDASEQAVMVDRCIMELENAIAAPIVKSDNPDEDQLIGNVQLEITNNAGVCSAIASEYYLPELGARSFAHGIDATITNPLISQYLEEGDDFSEDQAEIKFKVGTNEENEIVVAPLSTTEGTNGYLEHGYSY
ncbi:hypothetical protein M426DRAFT_234746 [Hypoxylon sp. CI-4A]|nr:hypothetical protein M426DRAFT_234746 [Hypoxylon sp. CI-4A]